MTEQKKPRRPKQSTAKKTPKRKTPKRAAKPPESIESRRPDIDSAPPPQLERRLAPGDKFPRVDWPEWNRDGRRCPHCQRRSQDYYQTSNSQPEGVFCYYRCKACARKYVVFKSRDLPTPKR